MKSVFSAIIAAFLCFCAPLSAIADDLQDGAAALRAGEDAKAAEHFRRSAGQGNPVALYSLGVMLEQGRGVSADQAKAFECYLQAANQGFYPAQVNLGAMYASGRGTELNYEEAAKWYLRAADQGDSVAWRNLAVMASKGQGVKQDLVEAWKWADLAAREGDDGSARLRDLLAKAMTKDQLAEARSAADRFRSEIARR